MNWKASTSLPGMVAQLAVDPPSEPEQLRGWKPEVQTSGDGDTWSGNTLVFATEAEARAYVRDLMWRWIQVTDTRVVETAAPVNYRWTDNGAERIEP